MEDLYLKLSSSRQLTRYREDWPGDKKGCVFYVPQKMAICLINAPWRKEDTPGQFDVLHGAEVANISEQDILLQGLPALLLCIDPLTDKEGDLAKEIWDYYKQSPVHTDILQTHDAMALLIKEAMLWKQRKQDILEYHFGQQTMYLLDQYMRMLFRRELAQLMKKPEILMLCTHSLFIVNTDENEELCTYFDFQLYLRDKDRKVVTEGFPASYVNYRMARYAIERILTNRPDMDDIANVLIHSFSVFCPATNKNTAFPTWYISDFEKVPRANQVRFDLPIDNAFKLYEAYFNIFLNRYQRDVAYRQFFLKQLKYSQERDGIDSFFDEEQRKDIWSVVRAFLECALKHMKGHDGYGHMVQFFEEAYPASKTKSIKASLDIANKPFKFLTRKCYDENKVQLVESELEAAIAESDPAIWDCLLRNIHLGYIEELDPLKSTQILLAIEARFGKTGRSSRNFNIARTKARFQRLG